MSNENYSKIMTKGLFSSLENTPVENGKVRFTTDTNQLFVDTDGERHEVSDVIRGYTESEIKSLLAPLPKIYLSSDTHKFLVYASEQWIPVGKNEWIGTKAEFSAALENGEILEGMTVYITDDYTGEGADLSIYATNEYVDNKIAQIVANAPAKYDTLKKLADWIESDTDGAVAMDSKISQNASDISTINSSLSSEFSRIFKCSGITVDLSSFPNGIFIVSITNLTSDSEVGAIGLVQKSNSNTVYMNFLSKFDKSDDWTVTVNGTNITLSGTNSVTSSLIWSFIRICNSVI